MRAHLLVWVGVVLLGRPALAGEPKASECLAAHEESLTLKKQAKLVAAKARLLLCSSPSCPAAIRTECAQRAQQVDAALPTISFEATDATGVVLVDVMVKMDGDVLADHLDGGALTVDPGAHTFTFDVPGRPQVQQQLELQEGQKERRERIVFEAMAPLLPAVVPVAPPPPRAAPSSRVEASLKAAPAPAKDAGSSPVYKRWWFWTAIGVVAAGGVVAALMLSAEPEFSSPFPVMPADPK